MRHGKKSDAHIANSDGRIPEEEELVHAGDEDGPDDTNHPCTEGVDRHGRVVGVGDGGADLGVGRVILCGLKRMVSMGGKEKQGEIGRRTDPSEGSVVIRVEEVGRVVGRV